MIGTDLFHRRRAELLCRAGERSGACRHSPRNILMRRSLSGHDRCRLVDHQAIAQSLPKIISSRAGSRIARCARNGVDRCRWALPSPMPKRRPVWRGIDPDLGELLRRLGSKQVRASGTIGGNIANGSPIGDTPPALIALGARLELRHGEAAAKFALEDFFIAYGKQDRAPGEVVWRIDIPEARKQRAFPLLQDRQALRPGHFGRDGRLQADDGRAADQHGADRLWRHGGNAEACARKAKLRLSAPGLTILLPGVPACAALAR